MDSLKEKIFLYQLRQKRDPEAFAELYRFYAPSIYKFLFFKLRRKEDAEDLTSRVFLKAWEYVLEEKFLKTPIQNFKAFVFQIARNLVIDFYRDEKRQEVLFFDGKEDSLASEDFLEKKFFDEEKRKLLEALDSLKSEYREILFLRHLENLSFKEIAQILGKSALALRVLHHRALKALKKKLKEGEKK